MVAVASAVAAGLSDDPERWRDSMLWNEKKPVSFYARYQNGDEVAGGITLGVSNNQSPTAAVALSNKLSDLLIGDIWSNLKYSAQLNHDFLQAVVTGNRTDLKYLFVPKVLRANKETGAERASVGGIVQGDKSILTHIGATANIFGILVDSLANSEWTNVKEISVEI